MLGASPFSERGTKIDMDAVDKKIINALQENARATISDISNKVSLTLRAVSERLKKLEASGIIKQYTAIINPAHMNKNIEALIMLRFDSIQQEEEFKAYANTEADIQGCVMISGIFNYCIKVFTENTESLDSLVERIKEKGASRVDVSIVLSDVLGKPFQLA